MRQNRWFGSCFGIAVCCIMLIGVVLPGAGCAPVQPPPEEGVTEADVQQLITDTFDTVDRDLTLWNIQPGLGTVMIEYGRRFALLKFAADAGDWGMAQYQLKEAIEIQEVGETTRPANADLLKSFENTYLDAVSTAIEAKDATAFNTAYTQAISGCNACHVETGHDYVVVQPATAQPQDFLLLLTSDLQPPPTPSAPPAAETPGDTPLSWTELNALVDNTFNNVNRGLALWNIQPGVGTVMMEYGRRFALLKFAADAEDWGMAQYQLKEAVEIQEVGETTRPARAALLKTFEGTYLDPLSDAINNQDVAAFGTAYTAALNGCNACHRDSGFPFVRVQSPPTQPQSFLVLGPSDTTTGGSPPTTPTPPTLPSGTPSVDDAAALMQDRMNTLDRTLALWNIQPGVGTVMMEYGHRFALVSLAADAENWGMAAYQLKEAIEIQEVGETTRPARAEFLKNFEHTYLDPVSAAIDAQDAAAFNTAYDQAITGCNACHVETGFSFVVVQRPPASPADFLRLGGG